MPSIRFPARATALCRGGLAASLTAALLIGLVTASCGDDAQEDASAQGPAPTLPSQPGLLPPGLLTFIDEHVAAVRASPRDAAVHGELGLVYEANELWPEARASLEIARSLDPGEPLWHLHAAIAQARMGDFDAAVASLQGGAQRHPGFAPLRARLGDIHLGREEIALARSAYEEAARLAPDAPEPLFGLGEVVLAEGNTAAAIEPLERAIALDPDYRAPRLLLGMVYREVGRTEEAEIELALGAGAHKRALPDAASRRLALYSGARTRARQDSRQMLAEGRAGEAVELLEPLVARYPGDARLRVNFGLAQLQLGQVAAAQATLAEAEALDPTLPMVPYNRAAACLELGRAEEALQHADRALALMRDLIPAQLLRAHALLELERFDEARAAADQALTLDARLAPAHEVLGEVADRAGRAEEAREAFLRAAELAQNDGRPWPAIFRYGLRSGDLALAVRALENLRRLDPHYTELEALERELEAARSP